MDVEQELKAVNFKVKLRARRMALEAEARIYGVDPDRYVAWALWAQEITAAQLLEEAYEAFNRGVQRFILGVTNP